MNTNIYILLQVLRLVVIALAIYLVTVSTGMVFWLWSGVIVLNIIMLFTSWYMRRQEKRGL